MHGYLGKILRVNLTSGQLWDEPLNETYARQFVGGSGLGARYLADLTGPNTDPLGPDNPLIFMTGPFVGTQIPAAGRYSVVARSPQTGLTGEANSGGFFGPALRQAGYDGIIVTGTAREPVYLSIVEGQTPELRPAGQLWGLDSYETQRRVQAEIGEAKAKVACIGLAGENLVNYAAVMNDHGRAAARTGMGAVMGSKKLKAIAAFGRAKVPLAAEKAFKEALRETTNIVNNDVSTQMLRLGGTVFYMDVGDMYGDVPAKYYTQSGLPEAAETVTPSYVAENLLIKGVPCFRCPISCGREVHLDSYGTPKADGPEYETTVGFGPLLGSGDMEGIAYAGHLCNVYGLDTISASSTIAFAFWLFEQGIITQQDTGGLALTWGNITAAHELIGQIARREGFGALLAEGARRVGRGLRRGRARGPGQEPGAAHARPAGVRRAGDRLCHGHPRGRPHVGRRVHDGARPHPAGDGDHGRHVREPPRGIAAEGRDGGPADGLARADQQPHHVPLLRSARRTDPAPHQQRHRLGLGLARRPPHGRAHLHLQTAA